MGKDNWICPCCHGRANIGCNIKILEVWAELKGQAITTEDILNKLVNIPEHLVHMFRRVCTILVAHFLHQCRPSCQCQLSTIKKGIAMWTCHLVVQKPGVESVDTHQQRKHHQSKQSKRRLSYLSRA